MRAGRRGRREWEGVPSNHYKTGGVYIKGILLEIPYMGQENSGNVIEKRIANRIRSSRSESEACLFLFPAFPHDLYFSSYF